MIGPQSTIAEKPHRVTVEGPGDPVPDSDGGYTQSWASLAPPQLFVKITPATARDLERTGSGTVITTASHIVVAPYHPQLTTECRLRFGARVFSVTGIANRDERNVELVLLCEEVVT